ncbi:MAG: DEAD/DEAH box helicase family protein [Clostridiales bacterium]|nr:DEAD/DEAH box helicase family protein [Clostridiales bacterium]
MEESGANRFLGEDSEFVRVSGLELYNPKTKKYVKSDIFTKDTIGYEPPKSADSAHDALAISINETGSIDFNRMTSLTGKSKETLCKELDDKIILTPDGNYELIDVYLSGNVREKYEAVKGKAGFEKNAKLLRAVVPKDKTAAEIKPQLGASWIDKKYVAQFMHETFETYSLPEINYDKTTGTWSVGNNTFGNRQLTTVKYGTARADAMYLTERTLNMKQANVYDKMGDSRVLNKKETQLARQKQQEIKTAFEEWAFKDKTRRDELTATYNRLFNSNRNMQYASLAQYITFPGLSDTFKLRDYQKAAVARVVFGKNTLLAHGVGTGKTAEMIASAMELKRMGVVKKNMMIVPKHKVGDFRSDILTMYPNAKVLMATEKDFEKSKRAKLFSKIASNDWDIVVIGHTSFNKIPVKPQTQAAFIENEIADLESVITAARAESGKKQDKRFISSLEKAKKAKEVQLKALLDAPKDNTLTFEEMGVDSVFVDEAHNFKNLPFYTKLNVPGIKSGTAKRAQDLYMKTNYLRDRDGRVTFATATPITNTISELYNMTRYLRPDLLREAGIYSFDGWASTFGTIETKIEISPDGRSFRTKERFSKYHNVPEMIGMTRMFMDVLRTSDVIKDLPKAEYIDVTSPATDIHDKYVEEITERIKSISSGGQSKDDNMLLVTNDGRAMATDLRLVASQLGGYSSSELDVPESKINKCVKNIIKEYKDSSASKGVQFVFLDFGINEDKDARYGYNLYNDIINKLTAAGIDKSQIAKIGDYNTTAKKDALFEALNKGEIRILIGSTAKMGEGMNAQKKAVALHHLNAPYRPSDIEQREGRIIRYGNENKNVRIYRYIQEKSFDSYMWQMLARKAEFINQAMSDGNVSELEETDDFVLSAKTGMAIATGNPLIMKKVEVDEEVNRLMLLKKSYKADRFYMEDRLSKLPAQIESLKNIVQKIKNDAAKVKKQDKLSITIGKNTYEKRADAGKALEKIIKNAQKNGKKVHVGSYMGFEISYSGSIETGQKLIIDGDYDYSVTMGQSSEGDITRIINAVEKIPKYFAQKRAVLLNYEAELKTIRADMGKEFKYQKELDAALAEQAELNAALNMGNDDTQDMSGIVEEMDSDFEDGDEEDSDSTVHSSRDIDDYEYENYTYKALTEKDDMIVTLLDTKEIYDDNGKLNRAEIINKGLENVRRKGNAKNTNQNVYVYIPDIDRNVLVGKRGLSHGLTRNAEATARVTLNIGDILENAIRVNELKPRNNSKGGYVLLGIATDADNNYYPTRIVVNNHSVDEIEVLDVLYAVNAKKKNQSSNEAELPANAVPPIKGSSTISIPDLLAIVKNDFSDVLSDDVLSNLGVQRKKSTLSDSIKYSKDTADTDITSRWTAKPVEDGKANIIDRAKNIVKKDDVNIADIVKNISDKFGIPIATGKVTDPKASAIYKDKPETIRVRITNNLPTISHELGHHIDKKYRFSKLESVKALRKAVSEDFLNNYPEKERNSEAVAEFVRVYLANKNNAQRMCKAFWSDFVNTLSKEDLKALNSIASSVNKYMSYNLSQRYDAAIVSSQKKEKLPFRERWSKWYSDWVDAFHPQKEVMDYVGDITGKSLSGKNNAYVLATNSLNAHTVANFLICEGFRDLNGNIVNAKSFVDSIGMVDAKNIKLLDRYLVLRHSLEWIAPEQEDVTAKRVFADATLEDVDSIKKEISEIEKKYPEIKTAAENLYEYQDNVIKHFVIPAGGMTEDMLASLNRKYPCYVPFYRAVGKQSGTAKGTFANQRIPIARAKGSGALIISPTASIIRNTEKMVKFALRNQVMSIWADYADTVDGFGQFMEKVAPDAIPHFTDITSQKEQFADALQGVISSGKDYFAVSDLLDEIFGDAVMDFTPVANANKKIVTVLKNGKPSYYQIHNDAFYNSVAELSPQQTTGLLNIMDKIMQPMKLLITQNNPIFAATNAVRDFGTAYKLSEINNPVTFMGQYVKALSEIITNSKSYKQYKAMGGGHSSELSANIDDIAKTLRTVAQKDMRKARRLAYSIFRHPVETVATINDAVESIPRFMEFQRTLKSGGDFQEAIFNADDITTNFKRSGKGDTAKAVNKMIMFNNAAIQGVDKMFRTLTEKDPKKRYKTLLKWLLNALIMGIIGYFYNKEVDEDGYKNLSSYKKNNFYNFAIGDGNFISLPKPRENALLDTFTERTIEYIFGDNENAFYDFGSYLASQLLPPMLPDKLNPIDAVHSVLGNTVIGGLTDIGFNKDFKGTPIESKYDEYSPSNERYTENTSKAAYALGQTKLARYWDMSPKKIDHLISSYTGVLGQVNKALFPMSDSRRDKTIGLRNKFISDSNYSTDVLNRMYDNEEKAKKAFDYSGTIDNAVEYEQNAIITSYISGMLKAIKALPEDKQRNGRAYLLKALDHWNYNTTDSQRQMIRRIKDDTVSENCIITSVPKSSLEWTEKGVKYYYQMTPSEYNSYVKDYLKAVEQQRADKNKYNTQTEDYTSELSTVNKEVLKELSPVYKLKYRDKAQKLEK